MKNLFSFLFFLILCGNVNAQTKFSGVPLNVTRQKFCEEMSLKYEPVFYGNGNLHYFLFTFLGIDNCQLNVNGGDGEIYLQISPPYINSRYDHIEEAKLIFDAYTQKYGSHKYYSRSYNNELHWTYYDYYWELKDCEIQYEQTILHDNRTTWNVYYWTGDYRPGKETMSINTDKPKQQATLNDI